MFVVTSLHQGCPSERLSILLKFFAVDVEDDGRHGGNSKMASPSYAGGRNSTCWCVRAPKSIVDSSFLERWRLESPFKHSIILVRPTVLR